MAEKSKISEGLELTILKNRVTSLEAEIKILKNKRPDEKAPEYLPTKIDNLRHALQVLKNRISLGHRQPDDNLRLMALESELGRWLLMMEGVL